MKIIILCAGKGSRAKEVTGNTPKQLYPVPTISALGHLLNYVKPMNAEVRIVVSSEYSARFRQCCKDTIIEVEDSGGGAESVFHAIQDLRYTQTPLLILLGDQIPIGPSAKSFQGLFAGDVVPSTNIIAVCQKRDIRGGVWVKMGNNSNIHEFIEVQGDYAVPGENMERLGFDFIKRSDLLYEAIRKMIAYKRTHGGEYRLSTAYQFMLSRGSEFQTHPVRYLSVGDKENIEKTISYFEGRKQNAIQQKPQGAASY